MIQKTRPSAGFFKLLSWALLKGKLLASLGAAAFQYCATVFRLHALTEAVHLGAAAFLWLVCSLRHM
jgi:hypothetical protein